MPSPAFEGRPLKQAAVQAASRDCSSGMGSSLELAAGGNGTRTPGPDHKSALQANDRGQALWNVPHGGDGRIRIPFAPADSPSLTVKKKRAAAENPGFSRGCAGPARASMVCAFRADINIVAGLGMLPAPPRHVGGRSGRIRS